MGKGQFRSGIEVFFPSLIATVEVLHAGVDGKTLVLTLIVATLFHGRWAQLGMLFRGRINALLVA